MGFIVDLESGYFQVPERRLQALQKRLHSVVQSPKSSARDIAQVTGTIVSMGLALGPVARLWTRGLYRFIMQASTWGECKELDEGAMREIVFLEEQFRDLSWSTDMVGQPKTRYLDIL